MCVYLLQSVNSRNTNGGSQTLVGLLATSASNPTSDCNIRHLEPRLENVGVASGSRCLQLL